MNQVLLGSAIIVSVTIVATIVIVPSTAAADDDISFLEKDNAVTDDTGEQIRLEKNKVAHKTIFKASQEPGFLDTIPLAMLYLDENGHVTVRIDGSESLDIYEKHIREYVGKDAELDIDYGSVWFDTGYTDEEFDGAYVVPSSVTAPVPPGTSPESSPSTTPEGSARSDPYCSDQDSICERLYGGIKISPSLDRWGTLTVGVADINGTVGFVTASHVVLAGVGQDVYQPSPPEVVGAVKTNPVLDGRMSDSAFVAANEKRDISNKIFRDSKSQSIVTGTGFADIGTRVQKTGAATGTTDGHVLSIDEPVLYFDGTMLLNQTAADYNSESGDSGAPVYSYSTKAGKVTLYGVHIAAGCLKDPVTLECRSTEYVRFFSPWDYVVSELELNPVPTPFTKAHKPWTQDVLDLRASKSASFQNGFPAVTIDNVNRLLAWAGNTDPKKAQDNNPGLARYDFIYSAMKRWDERADLQKLMPEASLAEDVQKLVTWAGHPLVQNQTDPAKAPNKDLWEFVETYTLLRYYFLERDDLRSAIPQTHEDWDLKSLYCWAGSDAADIVNRINADAYGNGYVTADPSFREYYGDACKNNGHSD